MDMSDLNVVERAIAQAGSPIELARRLTYESGGPVSRQRVHGWRLRGLFPKDMMPHVARLTGISIEELLLAQPKERPRRSPVERVLERYDDSPKKLAKALTEVAGRQITGQMVNGWQLRGAFPKDVVLHVSLLTNLPVRALMDWD